MKYNHIKPELLQIDSLLLIIFHSILWSGEHSLRAGDILLKYNNRGYFKNLDKKEKMIWVG